MKGFTMFLRGFALVAVAVAVLTCPFIATALVVINVCHIAVLPPLVMALPFVILFVALGILLILYVRTL